MRELFAIAQTGLAFTSDPFDRERYTRLRQIVAELLRAPHSAIPGFDPGIVPGAEKGYATPKVEVRGAVFRDSRILMVRERSDGLWTLPGGWADVNRRKHAHPPSFHHACKFFFLCELTGGSASHSIETGARPSHGVRLSH